MSDERPQHAGMGSVIYLRPRAASSEALRSRSRGDTTTREPTEDGEGDDFRHRMTMNAIAFVFCTLLVLAGVWLAIEIAKMRKNQDCVLSGRPGCTTVEVPVRERW